MSQARDHARAAQRAVWEPVREELTPEAFRDRLVRLSARAWLILQISLGAALAWFLARDVFGHPAPFFAPVTAMICLGLTYGERIRRIIELTIGVAIGIFVGDVFVHTFGTGLWQIFAVVTVAMSVAVLLGAGPLMLMQAGIQGVIITTLVAAEGQALSRWLDAVIGGGVALVIAMLTPMRSTAERPRQRAVRLVGHLAEVLTETTQSLRSQDLERATRALQTARDLSPELEDLRDSTAEAAAAVKVAPLLSSGRRQEVREMQALVGPLDLAIRNVRVLARQAESALANREFVPDTYTDMVAGLAEAAGVIYEQLETRSPLSTAQEDLVHLARRSTWAHPRAGLSAEVMRGQLRSTVVDLLVLSGMSLAEARRRIPPTRDEIDPT